MNLLILAVCLSAPPMDYTAFHAQVAAKKSGQYLIAYVGIPKPANATEGVEVSIPGTPKGVWQCWKAADGRCLMAEVPAAKPATFQRPAVPVHRSHNCPQCGRAQYVISGWNRDGTHTHTCSAGHSWRH